MSVPICRRRCCGDGGFETLETVVIFPALVVFLLLVVFAGRGMSARNQVEGAARAGARAASQARSPAEAETRGTDTAAATVASNGGDCDGGPRISVDTSGFGAGGAVTVTVACTVRTIDLGPIAGGGSRTVSASATEVVDAYRRVGDGFSNSEGSAASNSGVEGG